MKGDRQLRLPFTDDIDEVTMPSNFKPLNMDKYNGTSDQTEYVESYISSVYLITDSEAIICKNIARSCLDLANESTSSDYKFI